MTILDVLNQKWPLPTVFLFLVLFQVKHFLADYPLQTEWMLGKFKDNGWWEPLAFHALVHAIGTIVIATLFGAHHVFGLGVLDFICHATMDRYKASPNYLGRYKALAASEFPQVKFDAQQTGNLWSKAQDARNRLRSNTYFWWALGFDQMVHHLTHYLILGLMLLGA
jgi:hypothetical protein